MPFWEYISVILYLVYLLLAIYASALIIYRKLDPVKSLSWIVVILLLPYLGLVIYLLFGQNFRKRKIFNRKGIRDERVRRIAANNQIKLLKSETDILPKYLEKNHQLIMLNLRSSKSLLGVNSSIELYLSGKDALDSMFEQITLAKQHIHLQSYIINSDKTGNRFKDILIKKALEGVEVRVIFDDVGCWSLSSEFKSDLLKNGVEMLSFSPVRFLTPTAKLNYRNHSKIIVVDGMTGFLGAVNVADRYYDGADFPEWRDTHIKNVG